jgi:methyltransferase-like protein/2-polyprenyl-3-methyl-5-hydroxy-6-metoxy-1,4-benzoquinol methylase
MSSVPSTVESSSVYLPSASPQVVKADNSYDSVPYGSYPIAASHPDRLFAVSKLFGLNPVPPENARILELGCAGGGNLLPIASQFPNASCLGIELSELQCDAANTAIKFIGLQNIKISQGSIADITPDLGKFDYILCHGVFSWVPESVREAILRVSSQNLSENGVAYVSYNTLPGWYLRGMVRDMMLRHVEGIQDTGAKIAQARALLSFLASATQSNESPHAAYLRAEAAFLDKQPDLYLFHDHLEEYNKPYFFQDFIRFASQFGLQFLGESNLATMWIGNLSAETSQKLASIQDGVVSGHYMDCIVGRSFRETLLVHSGLSLSRNLDPNKFGDIRFSGQFQSEPSGGSIDGSTERKEYKTQNGQTIFASERPSQLAIEALSDAFPGSLSLEQVSQAMEIGVDRSSTVAKVNKQQMATTLMQWSLAGYIDFRFQEDRLQVRGMEKPKAPSWTRCQARAGRYVTNLRHELIQITDVERHILLLLDGSRDLQAIGAQIGALISAGAIAITEGQPLGKKAREFPFRIAEQMVENFGKRALLLPS